VPGFSLRELTQTEGSPFPNKSNTGGNWVSFGSKKDKKFGIIF
jgi:hypothetical protein